MSKQLSFVNFSGLHLVNKCIIVFRTLEVPILLEVFICKLIELMKFHWMD